MSKYIPVDPEKWAEMVRAMAENRLLKAEVERLTKAHSDALADFWAIHKGYFDLKAEVERLRASSFVTAVPVEQYERLLKAGDAMEIALQADFNGCPYEPLVIMQAIRRWRTAKEGKQP